MELSSRETDPLADLAHANQVAHLAELPFLASVCPPPSKPCLTMFPSKCYLNVAILSASITSYGNLIHMRCAKRLPLGDLLNLSLLTLKPSFRITYPGGKQTMAIHLINGPYDYINLCKTTHTLQPIQPPYLKPSRPSNIFVYLLFNHFQFNDILAKQPDIKCSLNNVLYSIPLWRKFGHWRIFPFFRRHSNYHLG